MSSNTQEQVFVSYSSRDREMPQFKALLSDLDRLRRGYWYDSALKGGLPWWKSILDQIAASEIFLAVLSPASLRSVACQRELQWARDVRLKILPVQLASVTIPSNLSQVEAIDYCERHCDPDAASRCMAQLDTALRALDDVPRDPMPTPLPAPPELPPSYTSVLARFREAPTGGLTLADQQELLVLARGLVNDDETDQRELAKVLEELRERKDVTWETREAIGEINERLNDAATLVYGGPENGGPGKWKHAEFNAPRVDLWKLAKHLESWYETEGMQVSLARSGEGEIIVGCHSGRRARWTGAGAELTTVLSKHGDNVSVSVGGAQWKDKATSAGTGLALTAMSGGWGWPLLAPSVMGTYRQSKITAKTLGCVAEMLPLCNRD